MAEGMAGKQWARDVRRIGIVVSALALAACQAIVPRGERPAPPPGPGVERPQPARPPADGAIPQDTARDRVALLVPLTGPNAAIGKSLANATQLALLDVGSDRVRITTYDTGAGAGAAAERALADGNGLILGPLLADEVRAAGPAAHRAGVPILSFSNDTSVAGNGTYLMGYLPAQSIGRVVGYAAGRGVTNFAGIVPDGVYGERASTAFLRAVEGAGGKVLSLQNYPRGPGGMAGAVQKLAKAAPFGAVLIADNGTAAAAAAPLLRRTAGNARLLGTELWSSDAGIAARPALEGAWYASVPDGLYRQFAARYRQRFGTGPYRLASMGYDAVLLSVRIARDWRPGTRFPEDRLRDRDGFSGIDGAFRFGRDGIAERALEVQEIRGGAKVVVSPAPASFK